jgi:putative aldouronate transport system permease protein
MKSTFNEKLFYIGNYLLLALIGATCIFPLVHIISLSLSSAHAIMSGAVMVWPVELTLFSYDTLFRGTNIMKAFGNSVQLTIVGVVLSMVFTTMAAYPLSKKYFYARKYVTLATVFTMIFSGGLIPSYLVIQSLGLVNSYAAIWLPALVSTYNMLIMRSYFANIPEELEEAARIDGCSEWRLLAQIYLPLSMPVIATLALFYGVGFWNAFMSVLIYINDTGKFNLTVLVQNMIRANSFAQDLSDPDRAAMTAPEGVRAAGIMVMVLPMLLVYPLLQKYFIKGVMLGSIKG